MPIELERRKNERRKAEPGLHLSYRMVRRFPIPRGMYRQFGTVADISWGGLAAEYRDREMLPMENVEFALSVPDKRLHLKGLRMLAVSDFILAEKARSGSSTCRRRGFRFISLSPDQKTVLWDILHHHTVEPKTS